ncbi:MAG: hypothetical protein GX170_05200 [Campylobacteraceae bacterium]|jgi:hypothetical protein|nr:hypothetical protein [Campylobacteraceae bacterium]
MKKLISIIFISMLFYGCSSQQQSYPCVIGCGDERITPDRDSFIDISGISKPLSEFYIERNLNSELAKYPQGEIE